MKRSTLSATLALVCTLLSLPASAESSDALSAQPPVAIRTLSNGLRIVVVEDHAAPVVNTGVWYRFGSLYETPGKTGLAHALEHMMFRGTPEISASGLDDIVARMGAQMNAETTYDYTHFFFTMPSDKVGVALAIEADRMQHASLAQAEWNVERGAVLSEIDDDTTSPFFSLLSHVREEAYPGSAEGRTPLGNRADVASATSRDLARYYQQWYAPNNATLVVTGDVNASSVFALAERYFGRIPRKTLPSFQPGHPDAASGKVAESSFPFPFEVVDIAYAVPGDTEAGEPAISVLQGLIENPRAPFYRALVESNVALSLQTNEDTQIKGGLLHVYLVLNPGRTADEALAIFQNTMDQLLKNGFDPSLVQDAKRDAISERILDTDSIDGLADLVGYTYGVVGERVADEDARLAALTPDQIIETARTYLRTPTVVGHLRPDAKPPAGSSQKSSASAEDDFSSRVPSGKIVMPAEIAREVRAPTQVRSKLDPVIFKLPNGLTVALQERHDRPTILVTGIIDSSPAFEPDGKSGIASLASDLANFGGQKYDFDQQRKVTDELGAVLTLGERFTARGFTKDLGTLLAVLADGLEHPTFSEPYLSQEREQQANSVAQEQAISGQTIDRDYLQLLLAPGDPALRFPTQAQIESITRADLLDYQQRYWRPDLTTIAIVGDLTPEQARSAVEAAFGSWPANGPTPNTTQAPLPRAHGAHAFVGTDASEVFIQLGQPAPSRMNPDYDGFTLINQILAGSGSFESRLLSEMRQKRGLVYSVSSKFESDRDRGNLTVTLQARPQTVASAVRFVRSQLVRFQREPVSSTELSEAKGRLISAALLAEASPDSQATELLNIVHYGLPHDYYGTLAERYARISPANLQRTAERSLHPNDLIEIYAGPPGPWSEKGLLQSR